MPQSEDGKEIWEHTNHPVQSSQISNIHTEHYRKWRDRPVRIHYDYIIIYIRISCHKLQGVRSRWEEYPCATPVLLLQLHHTCSTCGCLKNEIKDTPWSRRCGESLPVLDFQFWTVVNSVEKRNPCLLSVPSFSRSFQNRPDSASGTRLRYYRRRTCIFIDWSLIPVMSKTLLNWRSKCQNADLTHVHEYANGIC